MKKMTAEQKREIIRRMRASELVAQLEHTYIRCEIDESDTEESRNLVRMEIVHRLEAAEKGGGERAVALYPGLDGDGNVQSWMLITKPEPANS